MERLLTEVLDAPGRVVVVDLADALADCCSTAPPSAPYELSFTKAGRVPVLVDPVGLERAARNLMDNAMRAVAGGGRIEVEVRARGTRGVLEVADSGPGFSAGRARPPVRVARADAESGRGLGLIQQLADHVHIGNKPGRGGTVVSFDKILKWREDAPLAMA
jgi:serine/threonine-protein kinase RsbW